MAKSGTRKNNDNISNSGFQLDTTLMRGIQEASRQHWINWQEVELVREYLNRHAAEKVRLTTRQIAITRKSATKILNGIWVIFVGFAMSGASPLISQQRR